MFGKKRVEAAPVRQTKEEQLGPKPADIPNTEEPKVFEVLLTSSLPSVRVRAHAHNFGVSGSNSYTHFVIHEGTTWIADRVLVGYERTPHGSVEISKWNWVREQKSSVVFAIRTCEVAMVAVVDNVEPVQAETLALDAREYQQSRPSDPRGTLRADGGPVILDE